MPDPNPLEGAMGGWWRWSSIFVPAGGPVCVCRAETILGGLIADFRVVPGSSTFSGTWQTIAYTIRLRYQTDAGVVELVSDTPVPDAALGQISAGRPRILFTAAWRFALAFRCSTWDAGTSTYATDGFVKLFINGQTSPLLSAVNVTIPRRLSSGSMRYTVAALADGDRIWARTSAVVPATTSEGALVSGPPADLIYFNEFTSGDITGWTPIDLYPGGGFVPDPHTWPDCGGDGGWGMSIYACGPNDAVGEPGVVNHSYAGLTRVASYPPVIVPPIDPDPDPDPDPGPGTEIPPNYHLEARYIRRLRRAPHVNNENLRVFYRRFELDLERGQALASGQGSEPYVLLRLSRDGGQTWGEEMRMAAGKLGEYQARVMARRLGQARDTVFEVVVSDPVAWSLVGAWLDLEPGAH